MSYKTRHNRNTFSHGGFTLIELLVVISIISLLISILLPSMSRAREQAKAVHCLARLKEYGNALGAYFNINNDRLPPALWQPDKAIFGDQNGKVDVDYGWAALLWSYVYREQVRIPLDYAVQRNIDSERWQEYFICKAVGDNVVNSGNYRVYLPAWSTGSYAIQPDGRYGFDTQADPRHSAAIEQIRLRLPIIGDANEFSERGDGLGTDDCSYIDAGEANIAGTNGNDGNRFSDRHYGGTNFLFPDQHADHSFKLRAMLARDWDLNGINDIDSPP